jgi:hypothetical protein
MRLCSETLQQRCRQSRLSNTRLAGEQHYLTFAGFCFRPPSQQQFEFLFPPNEVRQATCVQCLKAASQRSLSQGRPRSHRPRDTLEVFCPEVLKLEQIAE